MSRLFSCLFLLSIGFLPLKSFGQTADSTQVVPTLSGLTVEPEERSGRLADSTEAITTFSGSVGITNNGFSIIPTFSLNSPAAIMNFYWRRGRFSFDPDIRLVPDASKGGVIFWFRYRLVEQKKFTLRVGVHPAFSLVRRTVSDSGTNREITEMLRFAAGEVVPSYQITPNWGVSAVYLNGNGLQNYGPQRTHVLFLNNSIANINLGGDVRLQLLPTVFFLFLDRHRGSYFTGTAILSKKALPCTLQSTINQTLTSDIPGNQRFMWNVMVAYNFSKTFKRIQ